MRRPDLQLLRETIERIGALQAHVERRGVEGIWQSREERQSVLLDLILIGEALGQVSGPVQKLAPRVPWNAIRGLRNRLVHEHWLLDTSIIDAVLMDDIPGLAKALEQVAELLEGLP